MHIFHGFIFAVQCLLFLHEILPLSSANCVFIFVNKLLKTFKKKRFFIFYRCKISPYKGEKVIDTNSLASVNLLLSLRSPYTDWCSMHSKIIYQSIFNAGRSVWKFGGHYLTCWTIVIAIVNGRNNKLLKLLLSK